MSDARLRGLQREAAASGDVEAEARVLAERLRAGDLVEERLRLAAVLGHPAACRAHGSPPPPPPSGYEDLSALLKPFEPEVGMRAALAAGWLCLDRFAEEGPWRDGIARVIAGAEEVLVAGKLDGEWTGSLPAWARWNHDHPLASLAQAALDLPEPDEVLATLQAELIPWALGVEDPVRRRVADRGEVGLDLRPDE